MTIASIDIGTNTVILLVAEVVKDSRELLALRNEFRIPRMGKGLTPGNPFEEKAINTLMKILDEFDIIIKQYHCNTVLVKATNAFRIASNGQEIAKQITSKFGYNFEIVPGEKEAILSFLGGITSSSDKNKKTLVIDIGGGSTELIFGNGNEVFYKKSFPVGVVSGTEKFFSSDPPSQNEVESFKEHISSTFHELQFQNLDIEKAIAIAGTPTTLAAIKLDIDTFDESLVEGCILDYIEIEKFVSILSGISSKDILTKFKTVVSGREDVLLAGTTILSELMKLLNLKKVSVSTRGIRYGAIIDYIKNI